MNQPVLPAVPDAWNGLANVLMRAFAQAHRLLLLRLRLWIGVAVVLGLIAIATSFVPPEPSKDGNLSMYPAGVYDYFIGLAVAELLSFFVIADAVRTIDPAFRMTVGKFFGTIGYGIVFVLLVMLGFLCLIVPGIYISVKLGPLVPYYLLGDDDPFAHAFADTTDRFWQTLIVGLVWASLFEFVVVLFEVFTILGGSFLPLIGVLFLPIGVAALLYIRAVMWLTLVGWADTLRAYAGRRIPEVTAA